MARAERRRRSRRFASPRRLALLALGLLLVLSPQLFGGVFGWSIALTAGLAGAVALGAAYAAQDRGMSAGPDTATYLVLLGWGWTALQLLPLPRFATGLLQPEAARQAEVLGNLLGDDVASFLPLTLSPGGTQLEVLKGAAIASTFLAAWIMARLGHRQRVFEAVGASGAIMALVGLGHAAAGVDRIFGFYEPLYQHPRLPAPLINSNHFAGFLALTAPVQLGLALHAPDNRARVLWALAGAATAGACVGSLSRGGLLGLAVGGLVFGALAVARRRSPRGSPGVPVGAAVLTVAVGLGLGLYAAAETVYRALEERDVDKLEFAWQGMGLAVDHPLFGVGRGAFSAAFVSRFGTIGRATHPENIVAQWTSEWGFPVGLALLVGFGWALLSASSRARTWPRVGAVAGLVAFVAHELVDFASEMLGVAVVVSALLAAVVARRRSQRRPVRVPMHRLAIGVGAVCALLALARAPWIESRTDYALQKALTDRLDDEDDDAYMNLLRQALTLHPREPAFLVLGGARLVRQDDPRAVAWLNRAIEVAPGWAAPHVEAGRFLARRGRVDHALLELREAEARQGGAGARLACELVRDEAGARRMLDVVGEGEDAIRFLDHTARCLEGEAGEPVDTVLAARGLATARLRLADRALRRQDPQGALEVLAADDDRDPAVASLRARAHLDLGQPDVSLRVLTALSGPPTEPMLRLLARIHAAREDSDAMREVLTRLRARASGRAAEVAAAWVLEGRMEEGLGHHGAAIAAYERAHRVDPDSAGLQHVARLSRSLGQLAASYRAYVELCRRSAPGACDQRDRLRERLDESSALREQPLTIP